MFSEEHLYSVALRKCALIGDINFYKLVHHFGSAKNTWQTSKKDLARITGIGRKTVEDIGSTQALLFAEQELKFCEKENISILLRHKKDFPELLNQCEDAPAILYLKGKPLRNHDYLSIVGTRSMTNYGKSFLQHFFDNITYKKFSTVSGLALGVDTEVHQLSIDHNISTVAVLAHGFQTLYPSKNKKLAENILLNHGTLITEFNSAQSPDRENFIQRNRIIAGISANTMVIETAFGGGSISTVTFANQYNREVYALPGKITDKYSQGCNQLIAQHKARIIANSNDLISDLGLSLAEDYMPDLFSQQENDLKLSENQQLIYGLIRNNSPMNLDDLILKTDQSSAKILSILLELELMGKIKSLSGKNFIPS